MTDSLTGVWDGTFIQPGVGAVTFLATLIEAGGALSGSVTEPCMMPGCPRSEHNASLAGSRSGSAVSFVKRYEPPGYGYDTVAYEGSVNADATEIDGRWRNSGHLRHVSDDTLGQTGRGRHGRGKGQGAGTVMSAASVTRSVSSAGRATDHDGFQEPPHRACRGRRDDRRASPGWSEATTAVAAT